MEHSRTQIVATIGPASKTIETMRLLVKHQMDVARLNFSWGTYDEHELYIKNIRQIAKEEGKKIPIIQDLSGPRIQKKEGGHSFDELSGKILTEKDLADLEFGIRHSLDYIAMSYVGDETDILMLQQEIKKRGKSIPIIAKIERKIAIDNLDKIIDVADAVMIARGDLGNEVPIEVIPFLQKMIIQKSKERKKPVITATEMLASMVESSIPTRAEVTDVAHAILDGSDAVMLSEETAVGGYPVEAVAVMEKIVLEAEKHKEKLITNPLR